MENNTHITLEFQLFFVPFSTHSLPPISICIPIPIAVRLNALYRHTY